MSSYTPNIPQPTDDPSDSQDQILENFQTLQASYGVNGDHYPWTNTTPTEGLRHAKVRLPGLPTANPPGNIIPVPAINEGVIFALTAGSETLPFWRRDLETLDRPLAAFRAFGRSSGGSLIGNPFNISGVVQSPANTWTFTFINPEPNTDYMVLATCYNRSNGAPIVVVQGMTVNNFTVAVFDGNVQGVMAAVLRLNV